MSKFHLLIDKYIDRSISPSEREILKGWVEESESNKAFFKSRLKEANQKIWVDFDTDSAYQRFSETLKSRRNTSNPVSLILKYAAVLLVALTIGFLAKQQIFDQGKGTPTSLGVDENQEGMDESNKIVIKLADGTTKELSPEGDEEVIDSQGNIVANKGGNTIAFDQTKPGDNYTAIYHEVFIPYGQIFKLTLSDGTKVWLNAGSKLRFPQRFVDSEDNRMVYLEGEAFFEVTKNRDKPFIVNTQEVDVEVLGTKFNISSYETDDYIATTVVEGSVSIHETRMPQNNMILTPDFQAKYDKFGNSLTKSKVDTDVYTAWIEKRLVIDNLRFPEILVKLERRYFVKFVNKAERLNEEIYQGEFVDEDIESVLKTISISTPFTYEINQNIITITHKK